MTAPDVVGVVGGAPDVLEVVAVAAEAVVDDDAVGNEIELGVEGSASAWSECDALVHPAATNTTSAMSRASLPRTTGPRMAHPVVAREVASA